MLDAGCWMLDLSRRSPVGEAGSTHPPMNHRGTGFTEDAQSRPPTRFKPPKHEDTKNSPSPPTHPFTQRCQGAKTQSPPNHPFDPQITQIDPDPARPPTLQRRGAEPQRRRGIPPRCLFVARFRPSNGREPRCRSPIRKLVFASDSDTAACALQAQASPPLFSIQ
jgi:hypothetical protein